MDEIKRYALPEQEYTGQFIICLAMAIHCKVVEPSQLTDWFNEMWTQQEIAKELFKRVKLSRNK